MTRGSNKEMWNTAETCTCINKRKQNESKRDQWKLFDEDYRRIDHEVKKMRRRNKQQWQEKKSMERRKLQTETAHKLYIRLCAKLTSAMSNSSVLIKVKDGKVLTTKEEQGTYRKDHFLEVFTQPILVTTFEMGNELNVNMTDITAEFFFFGVVVIGSARGSDADGSGDSDGSGGTSDGGSDCRVRSRKKANSDIVEPQIRLKAKVVMCQGK
ncbi:Hypothetical predicted protein [Octopus vulgaris]|uniref:Uncharacterized protein n=1 Tax=Octopus vulgaris TaxID=6645 RepID=A0AA36EW26_OCTVU|nr:Hypothetical predicted protein [Octopus vulgaris]